MHSNAFRKQLSVTHVSFDVSLFSQMDFLFSETHMSNSVHERLCAYALTLFEDNLVSHTSVLMSPCFADGLSFQWDSYVEFSPWEAVCICSNAFRKQLGVTHVNFDVSLFSQMDFLFCVCVRECCFLSANKSGCRCRLEIWKWTTSQYCPKHTQFVFPASGRGCVVCIWKLR